MSNKKKENLLLIELGKRLKKAREKKAMSQTQLSYNCNMEKSSVSRIEAGQVNISYLTLHRLSDCLEVNVTDLTGE